MAADILELFEAIKEPLVRNKITLNLIILLLWQLSLFQFTLTKTITKARKVRPGFSTDLESDRGKMKLTNCICCQTELWAIATSLLLQDIPFFCLRMTLIVHFQVLSYSNIFFTCKNSLVIMLQLFRSYVIVIETQKKKPGEDDDDDPESMVSKPSFNNVAMVARWQHPSASSSGDCRPQQLQQHVKLIDQSRSEPENLNQKSLDNQPLPKATPEASLKSESESSKPITPTISPKTSSKAH